MQEMNSMLRPPRFFPSTPRTSRRAADFEVDTPLSILPDFLDVLLPACSKPCLRAFISDNYSSSHSKDLRTLCTTNTSSGFTLGEAALVCESAYCAVGGQVDKSIFSICASVTRAIRPSHHSLTVVPMATSQLTPGSNPFSSALPPTIGAPATTTVGATEISSATGAPSIPSASDPLPPPASSSSETTSSNSATSTLVASSITTRPGESDPVMTSGSSPSLAPAGSQARGNLNTGQIVGISLAAFAIVGFIVGLLLFLYYRRRESNRTRRGSRWSDVTETQPLSSFPPGEHHMEADFSNPRAATPDHSQRFYATPTTTQEKRRSFWRRSIKPEDIGVAVSPEVVEAGTPTSISSQGTTSQLLPELPHHAPWPAKIPLTPVYDNGNIPTTFGAILAARENALLHPECPLQLQSQRHYDPRLQSHTVAQAPVHGQGLKMLPPPPPPADFQTTRPCLPFPMRQGSSASDTTIFEDEEDSAPEQEHNKQLKSAPLSPIIESPCRLPGSPVDRLTTPLKDLTYPSPPRSAAISKQAEKRPRPRAVQPIHASGTTYSPLRSPTSATPPSRRDQHSRDEPSLYTAASSSFSSAPRKQEESHSTLLAKRKCDKAADQMLKRGSRLSSGAANASAANRWHVDGQKVGRARRGSDTENPVNAVLKTPPPKSGGGLKSPPAWTPRLTPTRMGEEMYLRVE